VDVRPGFLCCSCKIESWRGREHSHPTELSFSFFSLVSSATAGGKQNCESSAKGEIDQAQFGAHLIQSASTSNNELNSINNRPHRVQGEFFPASDFA